MTTEVKLKNMLKNMLNQDMGVRNDGSKTESHVCDLKLKIILFLVSISLQKSYVISNHWIFLWALVRLGNIFPKTPGRGTRHLGYGYQCPSYLSIRLGRNSSQTGSHLGQSYVPSKKSLVDLFVTGENLNICHRVVLKGNIWRKHAIQNIKIYK